MPHPVLPTFLEGFSSFIYKETRLVEILIFSFRFDNIPVEVTGNNPTAPIQTFDELFLPDTLKSNLGKVEFTKPTPVQKYGIPIILNGRDIMACAQTGSGKTVSSMHNVA